MKLKVATCQFPIGPEIDQDKPFYDASCNWRDRAMRGIYHSGRLVRDRRSSVRTVF